jgi:hypothetical protein
MTAAVVAATVVTGCARTDGVHRVDVPVPARFVTVSPTGAAGEVRAVFRDHRDALARGDGEAFGATLSLATLARYEHVGRLAERADAEMLAAASAGERYLVAAMRAVADAHDLRGASGREVVHLLVQHGVVRATGTGDGPLGEVVVDGRRATAAVSPGAALRFEFLHEDGRWRIDLLPEMAMASAVIEAVAAGRGLPVDEVVLELVAAGLGRPVGPDIWERHS